MGQSLCILGRQPALGIAELENLYGASVVAPLGQNMALVDVPADDISLSRLGGAIKVCKLLTFLPYTDWQSISGHLLDNITQHLDLIPEGKIRLGLSSYGIQGSLRAVNATGLELKKVVRSAGRSVRVVPNKAMELSSAQILHNQLTGPTGLELNAVRDGNRTALAQTVYIQDIDAYAARDQRRPMRDAKVGMLPPKLAQIIINLAVDETGNKNHEIRILDPFCGTGVLMQEALLMGYNTLGSDIEPRMVEYTLKNLDWLANQYALAGSYSVETADATTAKWQATFHNVATETYLGPPLSNLPGRTKMLEIIKRCNHILEAFLTNIAGQIPANFRLCVAVPAWKSNRGFMHLPCLDHLKELGYTRESFVHVESSQLIYHRPEQIVARELVVLRRT